MTSKIVRCTVCQRLQFEDGFSGLCIQEATTHKPRTMSNEHEWATLTPEEAVGPLLEKVTRLEIQLVRLIRELSGVIKFRSPY